MDRRNEPQFVDRMYTILKRLSESCRPCLRKGTSSCEMCWAREAQAVITDMNAPVDISKAFTVEDRTQECEQILNYINVNCGVSVGMIMNSFPAMNRNTVTSSLKRLAKKKLVVGTVGNPRVYFPFGTPDDAIEGITKSFEQNNRRKKNK